MTDAEVEDRQQRADAQLWTAIMEHADAYFLSRDGELLNHYAVVAHWAQEREDGQSWYTTHYYTPSIPNHIAEGLFRSGLRCIATNYEEDEREE